ncbi:MAG: LysR family transcriptional regulator [Acidobacteriota bacterium]|nr:LysR family transcriptional regulator [Acidobacteriota bacterium]
MPPTLHQLHILDVVAEEGGVTRAAARLHLTQPTLSIQLKQLADDLGEPLFEQVGRRLYLTDAGHHVRAAARSIAHEIAALEARLSARRGIEQGRLRMTVVSTAEYFMPRLLGEFQRAHPGIDVSLQVLNRAEVIKRLEESADDLYLMTRPPEGSGIRAEPMARNPLIVAAAPTHPWCGRRRIPVKALAGESFVVREPGSGTRLSTEEWLRTRGVTVSARLELGSNEAVKQAVRGGFGLAVLSAYALLLEAEHGLIVPLDVAGFPIPSRWHLVTRAARPLSPVAEVFRAHLKTQAMPELARAVQAGLGRRSARP